MNSDQLHIKKDGCMLLSLFAVHIACWIVMNPVFPEGDPLCYFLNAKKILTDQYILTNSVQDHRFGVFVPQAFFINLFGESPYIISLWPLLCSLLTILLVYFFLLSAISRRSAIIASLLLSVNMVQVIYSATVFPDIIVSFFSFGCAYFAFRGLQDDSRGIKNSFLFILFFALGFVSKESIVLLIPFVCVCALIHFKQGNRSPFLRNTLLLLGLFGITIFFISKILTGSYFFFLDSFDNYDLFIPLSGFYGLLKRVSYEPLVFLNAQLGYIFLLLFSIPVVLASIRRKHSYISAEGFIALYTIVLLAELWWGSFSVSHYGYVPITDRRWMMLIAPFCILSAIAIQKIAENNMSKNNIFYLLFLLITLGIFNSWAFSVQRGALFLLFAIALWLVHIMNRHSRFSYAMKTGVMVVPFLILILYFLLNNSNYVAVSPA